MNKTLLLTSLCAVICSGCIEHPSLEHTKRPSHWGKLLHQDSNFYQISEYLYRSEQPLKQNRHLLQQQGIQTIINLRSSRRTFEELDSSSFHIVHIPIHTWAINRDDVLKTMQAIKLAQSKQQKILLHCYHGSDRTGTMVAMYRILFQQWKVEEAVKEMKYGGYGFHPIWKNIDRLFSPENIAWLQAELAKSP